MNRKPTTDYFIQENKNNNNKLYGELLIPHLTSTQKPELDIVERMKILVFTNQLSWTENCIPILIKKGNNLMQLLRTVQSFGSTHQEMVHLWIVFWRSVLELSCVVCSELTLENREDLQHRFVHSVVFLRPYTTSFKVKYSLDQYRTFKGPL